MLTPERVPLELSNHEALVLSAFLARINKQAPPTLFEDRAEQRVLWNLESLLERQLVEPLTPDYARYLQEARDKVRDDVTSEEDDSCES